VHCSRSPDRVQSHTDPRLGQIRPHKAGSVRRIPLVGIPSPARPRLPIVCQQSTTGWRPLLAEPRRTSALELADNGIDGRLRWRHCVRFRS